MVYAIERYAAGTYLPITGLGRTSGQVLIGAVAGLTIVGPVVSGQLFRNRHATGSDTLLAGMTFVLLLPTLAIVLIFGLLAATLAGHEATAGAATDLARAGTLGLTPVTLIVVFDVVLFLSCVMAYVLGLAQRHPFQQAFVRNRRMRDRTIALIQRMGTRINDEYLADPEMPGHGGQHEPSPAAEREAAIRHAYAAAENAYYQGLIEAVADPTFTEAVMRRRTNPPEVGRG